MGYDPNMIRNGAHASLLFLLLAGGAFAMSNPNEFSGSSWILEFRQGGHSAQFPLPLEDLEVHFIKEPEYVGRKIVRSLVYLSSNQEEYIAFACDLEGRQLYLDLNRNLDLTDDPHGVFKAQDRLWGLGFKDVVLSFEQDGLSRTVVMDFDIYGERWGSYTVTSSWESEQVILSGKAYRVAVVDNGDGVIDQKDFIFLEAVGEEEVQEHEGEKLIRLDAPRHLILDGEPMELRYELNEDGKNLSLVITPCTRELIQVELIAEGIERLVMQDDSVAAVFSFPGTCVRLFPGEYAAWLRVRTGKDDRTALWTSGRVALQIQDTDTEDPVPWVIGGPIVTHLTFKRSGSRLTFHHAAKGSGGEPYSLLSTSVPSMKNPRLHIKKDGKVIHTGLFEYG